jgi:hypothetical protein
MVVGLDLKRQPIPIPQIHYAGIFPRPHHYPLARGGKVFQQRAGVFVAAVL